MFQTQLKRDLFGIQHSGHFVSSYRLLKDRHTAGWSMHILPRRMGRLFTEENVNHRKREKLKE